MHSPRSQENLQSLALITAAQERGADRGTSTQFTTWHLLQEWRSTILLVMVGKCMSLSKGKLTAARRPNPFLTRARAERNPQQSP